jgi:hypothetical protein
LNQAPQKRQVAQGKVFWHEKVVNCSKIFISELRHVGIHLAHLDCLNQNSFPVDNSSHTKHRKSRTGRLSSTQSRTSCTFVNTLNKHCPRFHKRSRSSPSKPQKRKSRSHAVLCLVAAAFGKRDNQPLGFAPGPEF